MNRIVANFCLMLLFFVASFGFSAPVKVMCTVTINSAEEREIFHKYLPKNEWEVVEEIPNKQKSQEDDDDSAKSMAVGNVFELLISKEQNRCRSSRLASLSVASSVNFQSKALKAVSSAISSYSGQPKGLCLARTSPAGSSFNRQLPISIT